MISVDKALDLIAMVKPLEATTTTVGDAGGRVLAGDVVAKISQPPFDASAMDGFAVRFEDVRRKGAKLRVIGEAPAGAASLHSIGAKEAVRIFTGGVTPPGADHILIQEHASGDSDTITVTQPQETARNIRKAGRDFKEGDVLKRAGDRLSPIDLALIAASNNAEVPVRRKPMVAYFDNGDELIEPGQAPREGEIIGSNRFAIEGLIRAWGGAPRYLGRAIDTRDAVLEKFEQGRMADVIIPIGGASVGDHDHCRAAFSSLGGEFAFEKVAVKPGKPTWFGGLADTLVLGLPGNPASAIVCAALFIRPLLGALLGEDNPQGIVTAPLAEALPAAGGRECFLRARLEERDGVMHAAPFADQDSSLLAPLAAAQILVRREANAPPAVAGDPVSCFPFAL